MASPAWKLPVAHFNGLLHDLSTPEPDLTYLRLQLDKSTPVFKDLLKLPGQAKQESETLSKGQSLEICPRRDIDQSAKAIYYDYLTQMA